MENIPRIGVGVIIKRNGKVLAHKRRGAHGEGTWGLIGGHLNFMETIEECARREALEEIGAVLKNLRIVDFTNNFFPQENKHYLTVFVTADLSNVSTINVNEPDKIEALEWFEWDNLPEPMFVPVVNLKKKGFRP